MDLLHNFLKYQLPGSIKSDAISKSIVTYIGNDKVFVIGLGTLNGIINEQVKENLSKHLQRIDKKVYFFSLFNSNEMFQMHSDKIAWGSYVWIATQPDHTIHFDNKPKLKARY